MRHFSLITLVVLSLALVATAPIGATPTATDDELDADDVRAIIETTDPKNASLATVRDVADWTRRANVTARLDGDDAQAVREWVTDAADRRPNVDVPDVQIETNSSTSESESHTDVDESATTTATATATATPSPQPTAQETPDPADSQEERIDSNTVIVASEYVENQSVALITIRSSRPQAITFSDAGKFTQGGKVPTTTIAAGSETTTVELPVTEVDGLVGVGISTRETTLYSEIIETRGGGGLGILESVSVIQAWLGGVAIAFVWTVIAGWSVMRREGGRPEVAR